MSVILKNKEKQNFTEVWTVFQFLKLYRNKEFQVSTQDDLNEIRSLSLPYNHCSIMLILFKWRNAEYTKTEDTNQSELEEFQIIKKLTLKKWLCLLSSSGSRAKTWSKMK